jgi:NitT/TauT family transport system substrate-binding protein
MFNVSRVILRARIFGAILVLTYPVIAAGAGVTERPEKPNLTIAYVSPSAAFTPLYVASEAGLFARYDLKANVRLIPPSAAAKGLLSGDTDFFVDGDFLIPARLNHAPVKYIGAHTQHFIFQLWGAKGITDVRQLKGKVIGVGPPSSPPHIAVSEALKKQGFVPDRDVKFVYNGRGPPAILTTLLSNRVSAGPLPAPLNLKARDAGLNLLLDIAPMNIPGLSQAYGTTEKYLHENPTTVQAFLKGMAEGILLAKKDPGGAKRAIAKFLQVDDQKTLDAAYGFYAPYWETNLSVREPVIRAELGYLDPKEFPQAKNANPKDFFDNSFVDSLERTGIFHRIGFGN